MAPSSRNRLQAVEVTSVRRYVEMTARVREQEQTLKVGAGRTHSKEELFEETVGLELEGSVYHPNFLEYSLAGLFGVLQEDFSEKFGDRRRSSGDDGDIVEFNVEGHFFKKKPYPGTVFGRRFRTLRPRPFLSSLETTTTHYGFAWQLVDPKTPTSLQFVRTEVELDPLNESEGKGRQENSTLRFDTEYRFSDNHVLSFNYERRSVSEEPFALDYDSDELTLSHKIRFGDKGGHRLESELVYFDQRGTFDIRRTRWREVLRLTHSEVLRSWYQFEFLDRTQGSLLGVPPIREESYFLSGTLEHQWYQSLRSQLYVYGHWQQFESGLDISRWGAQASFDYRKKNRWGLLTANYRYRVQSEDREGGSRRLEVVDERVTFRDPEPVVLSSANVVASTIVATDERRSTVYRAGEDYRVRLVGDRVEMDRVVSGRIGEGEIVLVDYVFVLGGDFELDTTSQDLTIRQNFHGGVSPYYRLRRQDQELSPENATGARPEDITSQTFGVEYDRPPFRLVAEFEEYESNINPFEAIRLTGDYRRRFDFGGTVRLRARWTEVDRTDETQRETRFFTVEGRYRHRVSERLALEGSVVYRNESDTFSGDDEGVDFDLGLEWKIRQTQVRVTFEHGRFQDDFSENEHSTLFVQFRREF